MSVIYGDLLTIGNPKKETFAYIKVTYPSGATCTCSDGTTTLEAPDTSGSYIFSLPNSGNWTTKISKTGETDVSQTDYITVQGSVVEVSLSFGYTMIVTSAGSTTTSSNYKSSYLVISDTSTQITAIGTYIIPINKSVQVWVKAGQGSTGTSSIGVKVNGTSAGFPSVAYSSYVLQYTYTPSSNFSVGLIYENTSDSSYVTITT